MNERQMARADFLSSIVLMVFGLYVIVESWRMPRFEEQKANMWAAPGLVTGLLGLLFVGGGLYFFQRSIRQDGHRIRVARADAWAWLRDPGNKRLVMTGILCIVFGAVLIGRMPFVVASGLFVCVFVYGFEFKLGRTPRQELRAIAIALAIGLPAAFIVTLVFEKLFLVTLP